MHRAALPGRPEDLGERGLEAGMGVGDRELDAGQPAPHERAQELAPERLGLRLADVETDDLLAPRLVEEQVPGRRRARNGWHTLW